MTALRDSLHSLRLLAADHGPDGWPAVRMADLSAALAEIDRLQMAAAVADDARAELEPLTAGQLRVLVLLAKGCRHAQAAAALGLSVKTIEQHCENMRKRLGMSVIEMIVLAAKAGLV